MNQLYAKISHSAWARGLLLLVAGLLVLSFAAPAQAGGRVKWKQTTIKERTKNESWRLEMEIYLSRPPAIAHQSMKFEFTQIAEYERALLDGKEGPQEITVPLSGQQSLIESVTVGFMDPGSGKIQARTRFSFKVTRAHGYKAGKWKVKIRDSETGAQVGQVTTLDFKGENPVVDRRSISFHGNDKERKKEESEESSDAEESESEEDVEEAAPLEDAPEGEGNVPPSIEEKPGGGCHHTPEDSSAPWAPVFLAIAIGGIFWIRRSA